MGSTITVRGIDSGDKAWLRRESRRAGISMEEFVRRLLREKREEEERCARPSQVFRRYFGAQHGIELPPRQRYGYRPVGFVDENGA